METFRTFKHGVEGFGEVLAAFPDLLRTPSICGRGENLDLAIGTLRQQRHRQWSIESGAATTGEALERVAGAGLERTGAAEAARGFGLVEERYDDV